MQRENKTLKFKNYLRTAHWTTGSSLNRKIWSSLNRNVTFPAPLNYNFRHSYFNWDHLNFSRRFTVVSLDVRGFWNPSSLRELPNLPRTTCCVKILQGHLSLFFALWNTKNQSWSQSNGSILTQNISIRGFCEFLEICQRGHLFLFARCLYCRNSGLWNALER